MQPQQMTVPFDRLMHDAGANVRKKYSNDDMVEMKASILAYGVIEPIAVRPPVEGDADLGGQFYRIFAGGRRFRAVGELIAEGKLEQGYGVPIIVRDVDDTTATAMSLAENLIREAMTPADEFRAFLHLVEGGKSIEDVALHFGQTERYVKGRMALANLHPEIFAAFEDGKLSFSSACAYTTNPDQQAQIDYYRKAGWQKDHSHYIKHALRREGESATSNFAQLIGQDAYVAAGGVVDADLFGDEVHWTSPELFHDLLEAKVAELRQSVVQDGWAFFATTGELGVSSWWSLKRVDPEGDGLTAEEQARIVSIDAEIAALQQANEDEADGEYLGDDEGEYDDEYEEEEEEEEDDATEEKLNDLRQEKRELVSRSKVHTTQQKAETGVVLDTHDFRLWYGVVRPTDDEIERNKKLLERSATGSSDDGDSEPLAKAAKVAKDPLALTQPLRDKIGETATTALAAAVKADPHRALALIASMLEHQDEHSSGIGRPTRLKVERVDPYAYGAHSDAKSRGIHKAFDTFSKKTGDELLAHVAGLFAKTIDLTEKWFQKDYTTDGVRERVRSEFMTAFAADPVAAFDAEAWFAACTKPMIDAAMKEMTGSSSTKAKKADMAREAADKAKETGWLPAALRIKGYALKGKKPAGQRKSAVKAKRPSNG